MSERARYSKVGRMWTASVPSRRAGGTCVRPVLSGHAPTRAGARRALDDAIECWTEESNELADALALAVKIAHRYRLPIDLVVAMARALYTRTPVSEWSRVTGRPPPRVPSPTLSALLASPRGGAAIIARVGPVNECTVTIHPRWLARVDKMAARVVNPGTSRAYKQAAALKMLVAAGLQWVRERSGMTRAELAMALGAVAALGNRPNSRRHVEVVDRAGARRVLRSDGPQAFGLRITFERGVGRAWQARARGWRTVGDGPTRSKALAALLFGLVFEATPKPMRARAKR